MRLWIISLDEHDFNKVTNKEKWFVIHLKVKLTVCGNDIFYNLIGFYMILKAKIVLGNWPDLEGGNLTQDKASAVVSQWTISKLELLCWDAFCPNVLIRIPRGYCELWVMISLRMSVDLPYPAYYDDLMPRVFS